MLPFDLSVILWPSLVIFGVTACVAFQVTRSPIFSLGAALIKAGIFLIYFSQLFDGRYNILDDWSYLEGGEELLSHAIGISNLVGNWDAAMAIGQGNHFIYYFYNSYAILLFGVGYYAPVALNILLTVAIAWLGAQLARRELTISGNGFRLFFAFLLFHPDILAWSNLLNIKDILVLFFHVLLLYSVSLFSRGLLWSGMTLALAASLILVFLRFYVPLLFAMAFMLNFLLAGRPGDRSKAFLIGVAMAGVVITVLGESGIQFAYRVIGEQFVNPFYGFLRMVLTPIPFKTDELYSFLNFPALIHWLLIPFVFWGVIAMYRLRTPFSRFFLTYLLIFMTLYAVYGELQGPRHRVQLDYGWAVLQFMGLRAFVRSALRQSHVQTPMSVNTPVVRQ